MVLRKKRSQLAFRMTLSKLHGYILLVLEGGNSIFESFSHPVVVESAETMQIFSCIKVLLF